MKKYFYVFIIGFFFSSVYAQELSPYYMIKGITGSISDIENKVETALNSGSFEILGKYNPAGKPSQVVIAFTSNELTSLAMKHSDRGGLGSVLKVAIRKTGSTTEVSFINPDYLFNAYFRENIKTNKEELLGISNKIKDLFKNLGNGIEAFGGEIETEDLQEYQYMWGMPEFTDPVGLEKYASFEEGLKTIQGNLSKGLNSSVKVYEHVILGSKVAIFGIGLHNNNKGEDHFLSIIGEKHIAAMPYEIILQGNTATMLHGRFRFALFWPELTMGTFTKIMSTPGDVEDFLKSIAKK